MVRYQFIFGYDGTTLAGSQRQANAPSAQSLLEQALRSLGWQGKSILLAGRTDSGVHASGQVAAADVEWKHSRAGLQAALNAHLPACMAIHSTKIVDDRFHPRFDALARRYRYRIYCQPVRDPLRERYAWRLANPPDVRLLQQAASVLLGTHDFAAFGTPPRAESSTVREVMEARWQTNADELHFEVQANAFLYRMVRRMVYLQVAVGQGRLALNDFAALLHSRVIAPSGIAPAHGLTLVQVLYPDQNEPVK
jgi:tRNA pseudouridine38-40 synthase